VGDHRGHQASLEYAKQRMSMRSGDARYSADPPDLSALSGLIPGSSACDRRGAAYCAIAPLGVPRLLRKGRVGTDGPCCVWWVTA
jgi:hypothetical protein